MEITAIVLLVVLGAALKPLKNKWYLLHVAVVVACSWRYGQIHGVEMFSKQAFHTLLMLHLISVNLVIFIMYFFDKSAAEKGAWRIPEKVMHGFALIGGTIGAFAGQRAFNHKKSKKSFKQMFIAILIVQVMVVTVLLYFLSK